uniref:(northern house mosquito) hypothetical protein n=1 Tax=Culex pipiens TaxID=7175 RepID=A0A8D8BVE8_CULPI
MSTQAVDRTKTLEIIRAGLSSWCGPRLTGSKSAGRAACRRGHLMNSDGGFFILKQRICDGVLRGRMALVFRRRPSWSRHQMPGADSAGARTTSLPILSRF